MRFWFILMYVTLLATGISLIYIGYAVSRFGFIAKIAGNKKKRQVSYAFLLVSLVFAVIAFSLNMMNAIVCAFYIASIWLICDIVAYCLKKIFHFEPARYYAGISALMIGIITLSSGWYLDHHVWRTEYTIHTEKEVSPLKIVMFADSHTGTTFNADGFARHVEKMQAENPDVVVVVGDFVDDDTSKEDMIKTSETLGNMHTKYGVFFVFGNHDRGYYGPEHRGFSALELIDKLKKNNVNVLLDETVALNDDFYLFGRRDLSFAGRKSMQEALVGVDAKKYMIVLDHQPADYENQAKSGADLVLSGHTHGGQLFPFNQVGKWLGVNDLVYGHEKRKNTDFIVTSGISDWAIKFKTGTKSEYVVVNIK